jgi:NAD(P)-dependent dehydrogenase (short-subunit alcohol dehydrogenase family)
MVRQRWGRIINFSSVSGFGNSGQANYSAAKEGIAGFTYAIARELGPYGVTCNIVNPTAATRLTATLPEQARKIRAGLGIADGVDSIEGAEQDPINNAPILVWLCTDSGACVNSQRLGTGGWQLSLIESRRVTRSISINGRWKLDELRSLVPASLMHGIANPAPARPS